MEPDPVKGIAHEKLFDITKHGDGPFISVPMFTCVSGIALFYGLLCDSYIHGFFTGPLLQPHFFDGPGIVFRFGCDLCKIKNYTQNNARM